MDSDEFQTQIEWKDQCEDRNTQTISSLLKRYEQQVGYFPYMSECARDE